MNFLIKFNLDLDSRSHLKISSLSSRCQIRSSSFLISPTEFQFLTNFMHSMLLITWWKYHVTKHVTKSCDKISVRRSLIGSKSSWIIGSYVDIIAVQEVRVLGGHLRFRQSDSIEQIRNYNFIKLLWVGCPRTP